MIPMLIQVAITLVTGTSIILANSLAVTNSVIFNTLLSSCSISSSSSWRFITLSRFSLRYLEALLFVLLVRRAKVSFTCLATSSSLTSALTTGFLKRSLLNFPLPLWLLFGLLFPPLPELLLSLRWLLLLLLLFVLPAAVISTRSLLIRLRFFFLPSSVAFPAPGLAIFSSLFLISLIIASFICLRCS